LQQEHLGDGLAGRSGNGGGIVDGEAEPVAGKKVTLDAATCVYPLRSSTGSGAGWVDVMGLGAKLERLGAGTVPAPPVSQ